MNRAATLRRRLAFTQTDLVRYQGASGDFNPLHHDPSAARQAGFDRVISVGMLQAGVLGNLLADVCGADRIRTMEFRFRDPAYVGEELEFVAELVADDDEPDADAETWSVRCRKADDTVVVEGRIVVAVG